MKSMRLGGEMNAFTTRETTTYYVKVWINISSRPSTFWRICFTIRVSTRRKKLKRKNRSSLKKFAWFKTTRRISCRSCIPS